MKDETISNLELNLPSIDGDKAIETCLQALYDDKTHCMADEFAPHAMYGDLIDALLAAREALDTVRDLKAKIVNDDWIDDMDDLDDDDDWGDDDEYLDDWDANHS